ncbi:hypothetical protein ACLB2K_061330 [Fragaria x ananassa]
MQGLSSSSHNLSIKERTASEGRPGAPAFDPPMPKSLEFSEQCSFSAFYLCCYACSPNLSELIGFMEI